ncbi:MAG TPA: adenosyl-hopene transferase HpnH [Candidatus Hypogeohydataceae bacterium YC38]|nr:adenosyl-hopene transferase HpnH [Candidatus Brocadiales bacterium]
MRVPAKLGATLTSYILKNRLTARERFPIALMLEPIHLCNLSCKGCGRILEFSQNKDFMDVEECLKAAEECGAPIVSITGGEPLLHPEIDKIAKGLLDQGRYVYLCTNGVLLEKTLDRLQPYPFFDINVHIDGLKPTHDTITAQEGVFEQATKAIRKAKKLGFRVCTNTTIYKDTKPQEVEELFTYLEGLGVNGMLVSPGFNYVENTNDVFLRPEDIKQRFGFVYELSKRFRLLNTPIYLKFLTGEKTLRCTPWGNPTRNTFGWKSPCYCITDTHYQTFQELMEKTDWDYYRSGKDPRCKNCMMHSSREPTAVLEGVNSLSDMWEMAKWSFS